MLIDPSKSVTDVYTGLLLRAREIDRKASAGTLLCANCGRIKSKHDGHDGHDGRCDCSLTSTRFRCDEEDERVVLEQAMVLIEKLKSL